MKFIQLQWLKGFQTNSQPGLFTEEEAASAQNTHINSDLACRSDKQVINKYKLHRASCYAKEVEWPRVETITVWLFERQYSKALHLSAFSRQALTFSFTDKQIWREALFLWVHNHSVGLRGAYILHLFSSTRWAEKDHYRESADDNDNTTTRQSGMILEHHYWQLNQGKRLLCKIITHFASSQSLHFNKGMSSKRVRFISFINRGPRIRPLHLLKIIHSRYRYRVLIDKLSEKISATYAVTL